MEVFCTVISFYEKKNYSVKLVPALYRETRRFHLHLLTKAVCSKESMVPTYQTTRLHNPEDHNIFTSVKISAPLSRLQNIRLIYFLCKKGSDNTVALNILWFRVQHTIGLFEWVTHFLYSQHAPSWIFMAAWGWLSSASQ